MSLLKKIPGGLRSFGMAATHLPGIRAVVHANVVRDTLRRVPILRYLYQGFGYESRHPFDRTYGTDTSGFASAKRLPRSEHRDRKSTRLNSSHERRSRMPSSA